MGLFGSKRSSSAEPKAAPPPAPKLSDTEVSAKNEARKRRNRQGISESILSNTGSSSVLGLAN